MNELLYLSLSLVAGLALGGLFFGGLWWTVQRCMVSQRPAVWILASWLVRTSITLAGFYVVVRGHWQRLLVCLCGFFIARIMMKWLMRLPSDQHADHSNEVAHAPQS